MSLFINEKVDLPDNYILFHKIKTLIANTHTEKDKPIYLRIGRKKSGGRLSNLEIVQPLSEKVDEDIQVKLFEMGFPENIVNKASILHNNLEEAINWIVSLGDPSNYNIDIRKAKPKALAYFYNHYHYTKGLSDLVENHQIYSQHFKLFINADNRDDDKCDMFIHVYVDKMFLCNIYESNNIPNLLIKIIQSDSTKISYQYSSNAENILVQTTDVPDHEITLSANYKRELFKYQKHNVLKMKNVENRIKNDFGHYETFLLKNDKYNVSNQFTIEEIDEKIFLSHDDKMMHESDLDMCKLHVNGGILADDIGLGKTCSMIGLMMESYRDKSGLGLCPTRLCKQWDEEIKITSNLKSKIVSSISQFKKIKDNISDYDVIIVSYNFLVNKNYHKFIEENPDSISLNNYFWERVILDEGHEYLSQSRPKKVAFEVRNQLYKFKSNFRWICTGTPFKTNISFWNIIFYLFQSQSNHSLGLSSIYNDDSWENRSISNCLELCLKFYHLLPRFCSDLFIKNTKESVVNFVSIPDFTINTRFLTQTNIERAIYDSALGDKEKMIQLCNHILVSEHHINILGSKPIPLDEIHEKMTVYYKTKIDKLTNQHQKLLEMKTYALEKEFTIEKTEEICAKISDAENNISLNNSKLNIFNKLNEKVDEVESCPICYDDFESKTRSITPCGHFMCSSCACAIFQMSPSSATPCPICRFKFHKNELEFVKSVENDIKVDPNNKWGTKMSELIKYINNIMIQSDDNRFIIFSQWDSMLKLVGKVLQETEINHLFLNGSIHVINGRIKKFKLDKSVRVVLLSSEKAASGLNLTEATHVVLLDTLNNDKESSKIIEEQAIGRSVRIGQKKNVHVQRFVMRDTIEHDYYIRNITNIE